jgi:hypothetical protein
MPKEVNTGVQTKANKRLADISNVIIVGGTIQDEPRFITARTIDLIRNSKQIAESRS